MRRWNERKSKQSTALKTRVLELRAAGRYVAEIAREVGLAQNTVHVILNEPEAKQYEEQVRRASMLGVAQTDALAVQVHQRALIEGDVTRASLSEQWMIGRGLLADARLPVQRVGPPPVTQQVQVVSATAALPANGARNGNNGYEDGSTLLEVLKVMDATARDFPLKPERGALGKQRPAAEEVVPANGDRPHTAVPTLKNRP